jgi:type I restriction enzyme S subunit
MTNVAYIDVEEKQFATRKLKYGDIIIEKSGGSDKQPVGRPVLFNIKGGDYSFSNFTSTLRVIDECIVSCDFLHKALIGLYNKGVTRRLQSKTTGIHNLDFKSYLKIEIPIPPKSTQLSIVSELDKINELIHLKKKQLKDYDNLAQNIFYDMFGDPVENEKEWEVKKLGEISIIKTGPFGSMLHKEDYITGGIPLINPMHMQDYKVLPDSNFTITKEKASELSNYLLKQNDVIFARRGDIGRCAIISSKEQGYLCGTGSLFVRFIIEYSSVFTMYLVRSTSFVQELVSKAKGATMLNLNSTTMENLLFPIPPLPLQQTFASHIEQIEKLKSEVQNAITDLETLLASRMQYWFE